MPANFVPWTLPNATTISIAARLPETCSDITSNPWNYNAETRETTKNENHRLFGYYNCVPTTNQFASHKTDTASTWRGQEQTDIKSSVQTHGKSRPWPSVKAFINTRYCRTSDKDTRVAELFQK